MCIFHVIVYFLNPKEHISKLKYMNNKNSEMYLLVIYWGFLFYNIIYNNSQSFTPKESAALQYNKNVNLLLPMHVLMPTLVKVYSREEFKWIFSD